MKKKPKNQGQMLSVSLPQCIGRLKVLQGSCVSVGWGLGIIIQFITGLSLQQQLCPPLDKIVVIKPTHHADERIEMAAMI